MIEVLVIPEFDERVIEGLFERPGRNDPCHCASGKKYKKCHEEVDREAWRALDLKMRQAAQACVLLKQHPSNEPEYDFLEDT